MGPGHRSGDRSDEEQDERDLPKGILKDQMGDAQEAMRDDRCLLQKH